MKVSDVLHKLIRACVDDERTLRHECKFVDASRAATLTRFAGERVQFVAELERVGNRQQSHDGSWVELSREARRNMWVMAGGRNISDAIESCRQSRARAQALYDEALQASWPDETRRILESQRRSLLDEALELNRLEF